MSHFSEALRLHMDRHSESYILLHRAIVRVGEPAQLPCAILEEGDDAAAIEASLIENSARLAPDEVSRWECFIRLIKEGRRAADIAATFGLPDLSVKRILALGNLLPRIRDLYRREEIDAGSVRHLTLASKTQQKAWLALLDDPDAYAPKGFNLKAWLFGGQSIPSKHALFDVAASGLNATGRILMPPCEADRPHLQFVRWHREHCFKH